MMKFFSEAIKIRNLFGVAIFCLILVYLMRDSIVRVAGEGENDNLSLLLGFLFFVILGVLGVAGYYAIVEKDADKGNVNVEGSKKVTTDLKNGGSVTVRDSEEVKTNIDNAGPAADPEKKT
ncbi:MAG: hypothetical protein JNL02_01330 [Saprospiraceae bacterium]|nr:hypothetical protein [Saprospiraceae bacterium]